MAKEIWHISSRFPGSTFPGTVAEGMAIFPLTNSQEAPHG